MMTIYFYGSNREIVAENVKKCYSMIKKYGFNAAMGKIKLVGSEDLTGEKLLKVFHCSQVQCQTSFNR